MRSGFVYIWRDRTKKLFYIGSHLGHENDGYICSSNSMREAFRRRPKDFRRRILRRFPNTSAAILLKEEDRWLQLAAKKPSRYYNKRFSTKHWLYGDAFLSDETRKKMSESAKKRGNNKPQNFRHSDASRQKMSESRRGNTNRRGKRCSEESRIKMSIAKTGSVPWNKGKKLNRIPWNKGLTSELDNRIVSQAKSLVMCPHCNKAGGVPSMHRWHFDNCKERNAAKAAG